MDFIPSRLVIAPLLLLICHMKDFHHLLLRPLFDLCGFLVLSFSRLLNNAISLLLCFVLFIPF